MRPLMICLFSLSLWTALLAEQPTTQQPNPSPAKKVVLKKAPPKPQGLTVDGIVSLVQAGLAEDVIIARLRKEDKAVDLSPEDMIKLKKTGVSNDILKVMIDPRVELKAVAAPPAPPATPQPTVVQIPTVPVVVASNNPSGATPI